MNERIKELFEQAHIQPPATRSGQFAFNPPKTFSPEKFAELIVQECIDIAQDRANFPGFPPNDVNHIIDEIREHFGVEE